MVIFGKCFGHSWKTSSIYHDCSDICMWSSGTVYYRVCQDCGYSEERRYNSDEWSEDVLKSQTNGYIMTIKAGLRENNLQSKNPKKILKMVKSYSEILDYYSKTFTEEAIAYKADAEKLREKIRKHCPEHAI